MPSLDTETFGPVLHGAARAWRLKLDERLKPMGLSQAKWRTLLHLSMAETPLTQAEIAARLGIEEPTLVSLLHRLEKSGWVVRRDSEHDRRCKTVHLGKRAQGVISQISATAEQLRRELLKEVPSAELRTCIRVLEHVRQKAEEKSTADRANGRSITRRNGVH
ncbi:MAG TPA: MarR family transcriptional regulator [Chthoniobacterales bacterium]|nr:MarR family transcriptional regulator [Chthoniobacterales bacterium]